ncbi:MAG: helix-turn-helix domain-containing protein [Lachnospirales bacterium]
MDNISNERFAKFILELRKEKGLTQKQLAEQIGISDKAVSKWERGLSLPDIALLIPLAELLNVSTTELLNGKRFEEKVITFEEVENLVVETIKLSKNGLEIDKINKSNRQNIFIFSIIVFALEVFIFLVLGYKINELLNELGVVVLMVLVVSGYFAYVIKDTLPTYYDENKISFYHQGMLKMSIVNLKFNNSNWKYVIKTMQMSLSCILVLYPLFYLTISWFYPEYWNVGKKVGILIYMTVLFLPSYIVGKKYE